MNNPVCKRKNDSALINKYEYSESKKLTPNEKNNLGTGREATMKNVIIDNILSIK